MKKQKIKDIRTFITNITSQYHVFWKYFLAVIGCIALCSIFYVRFIRERLPQTIPFSMTELRFYSVLFICLLYLYIIKMHIKPKMPNEYLLNLRYYFQLPLYTLDNIVKTSEYSLLRVKTLLKNIYPKTNRGQICLIVFLQIIPRIILVIVFIIDVVYFQKLNYFYNILPLGTLPLVYSYHKYSMHHAKEIGIEYLEMLYSDIDIFEKGWDDLENNYEFDDDGNITDIIKEWKPHPENKYHDKVVTIREYIEIVLQKDINNIANNFDNNYELEPVAYSKEFRYEQYRDITGKTELNEDDFAILRNEFNRVMPILNDLSFHLHCLPNMEKRYWFPQITLTIYISWFLIWTYILYKSFHTLQGIPYTLELLKILAAYSENLESFIDE